MINTSIHHSDVVRFNFAATGSMTRVLMIGQPGLLEHGMDLLLSSRKDLEVFHAVEESAADSIQNALRVQPGVIVLCQATDEVRTALIDMLAATPSLSDVRIILVHLKNTALEVYEHCKWFSASQSAFFPLVYGVEGW